MIPAGIVSTAWPRVVAKCAELGVSFDAWQHGIGSAALGKRKNGQYAATVGGIVLSIPRQVGKTFLVGMIVIALCLLFPGMTVLWTAHRTRTATKTFHTLKGMTERPKIKPLMLDPRLSNGEQEIRFRNGSVIMFGAREQGFGRGFDEVDVEVFDEAQILTEKALEDMVPATNQSRQPSGALLFFMGTPPRPGDPGDEFTNRRSMAITGQSEDMVYVEFSADPDADPNDRAQWAKANPSFPSRTPVESMKRMRANLTDDASFLREGLGVWDETASNRITAGMWAACADPESRVVDPVSFGIEVNEDRSWACIAVAGRREDGRPHGEIVDYRRGTDWIVERAVELRAKWQPLAFVVDAGAPAGSVIPELEARGITVSRPSRRDVAQTCGALFDAVKTGEFRHRGEPALDISVRASKPRPAGDAWVFERRGQSDVTPLLAMTLALRPVLAAPVPLDDAALQQTFY